MSVSVIIPVKNRKNLLRVTLNNILSQSLKPTEIIVVDDHSEESLEELKMEFNNNVRFINSDGYGPGAARNTGFRYSTGKYIQFFDSDDLMSLDKLKVQVDLLKNSRVGMSYCTYVKAEETADGQWRQMDDFMYFNPIPGKLRYDQQVLRGANMITQACLFTRELLLKVGPWREDLMPHEDLDFMFRVGQLEPYPIHTNIPFVLYRQHLNQITDKDVSNEKRDRDAIKAHSILLESIINNKEYTYFDVKFVQSSILHDQRLLQKYGVKSSLKIGFLSYLHYFLVQISKKVYRKWNKTQWSRYNSVSTDRKMFVNYIAKIKN